MNAVISKPITIAKEIIVQVNVLPAGYDDSNYPVALTTMRATKVMQDRNLLLPIPQRVRTLNENLEQNNGY